MRTAIPSAALLLASVLVASCACPRHKEESSAESLLAEIVALERSALDRWIRLDPQGYLDLYAREITYFDPTTEQREAGLEALQTRLAPIASLTLPFTDPRYEMIDAKVQRLDDVALLTFNLINYGTFPGQPETVVARWNATEVYVRIDGEWKIAHSHWSYTKPEIEQPGI
jgi:ketosteroid isomerase-like protein